MTYAIGIVAHPKRAEQAHHLAAQVEADVIVLDTDSQGERWCHQETLAELRKRDTDWYVLLEDDATPCPDFRHHLAAALADAPEGIVSLYLGTGRWADADQTATAQLIPILITEADNNHTNWITSSTLWHAVGIAIPAQYARSALAYMRGTRQPTDKAISQWARAHHLPVHYTWPSFVDHADNERLTGEPHGTTRRAWRVNGQRHPDAHTTA